MARSQELPETRQLTIPGTTVSFDLVRLPLAPGGGPADAGAPALWMARTETTFDAFDVFVYGLDQPAEQPVGAGGAAVDATARPTRPYIAVDRGFGHAGYAALSVSVRSVRAWCAWLSAATGLTLRLPTEDEWEAACRAGAEDCNPDAETLRAHAWYRGNSRYRTHPVGTLAPNAWGLYDMAGNVSEWADGRDGQPVLKGGSYLDGLADNSCARRRPDDPAWNVSDPNLPRSVWWLADGSFVGFRVVCEGELAGSSVSPVPSAGADTTPGATPGATPGTPAGTAPGTSPGTPSGTAPGTPPEHDGPADAR